MENEGDWLALAVGNSRLHWGWFRLHTLVETWDTPHLTSSVKSSHLPYLYLHSNLVKQDLCYLSVYLASVVAHQTECWHDYGNLNLISLKDIGLTNTYPTIGVDRALAAWGAVSTYNQACLVIDGGTALTFTGVNQQGKLIGGAILPGLRSQLLSLKQKTSALPEIKLPDSLPPRWALDTDRAIASGVVYTAIASIYSYIVDWLGQFPNSQIIFTGGDAKSLSEFLHQQFPDIAQQTTVDLKLVFQGIKLVHERQNNS